MINPTFTSKPRLDIASTAATEVMLVVLSFITGILSARLLGPAGRGELAIVILWPSVIAGLGNLGIREALVYFQANGEHSSSELAGAGFLFALFQSLILIVVGWLLVPLLTAGKGDAITRQSLFYLWFIPFNLMSLYSLGLLRGQLRIYRFNLLRGSISVIYLSGMILLWWINRLGVQTLTIVMLLSNIIVAILAWWSLVQRSRISFPRSITIYRDLFTYGIKNHFGTISSMLNARLDQMLMAIFLTPTELGWYVVAVSVSGLVTTASATLEKLLFPRVARAGSEREQFQILSTYSRFNFTATLLIGALIAITVPLLIPFVYSTSFRPAVLPAEILIIAGVFLSINQNWEAGLRGLKHPGMASKAELFGLIITGISLFILLPTLRIFGAAIASLIAYLLTTSLLFTQYSRYWNVRITDLLRPVSIRDVKTKLFSPESK